MDTIRDLCQQYHRGDITRDALLDQLTAYPYTTPEQARDVNDDAIVQPDNTIHDIMDAVRHGLIDDTIYTELLNRLT